MQLRLFAAIVLLATAELQAVTIPTVPVGNAGNASDMNGFGAVAYDYRIGMTEVTNAQYADFLNAKVAANPLGLYNTGMASDARGGITQSGISGGFAYAVKPNMGNKPVNYVSWYDAIRFANWLHNGQGIGSTETGAYEILGNTTTPSNGLSITRNPDAAWWLPSENEWYKAAYYQPAAQGGDADNYWLYPTQSNSAPTIAAAINTVGPTRGDIANAGFNVANYNNGAVWNSQSGNVTTVGTAGLLSQSFYGTSDQGGNVREWDEALINGTQRGARGGSWSDSLGSNSLRSSSRISSNGMSEFSTFGFRVATVPEPSTYVMAAIGIVALLFARRRR